MHRFFISDLPNCGSIVLGKEDARHAITVLRLSKGDSVQLFDGKGTAAIGCIGLCSRGRVEIEIVQCTSQTTSSFHRLDMVVALPKGDRQRVLVDMLVQLGATSLTPLQCTRSVAQPTDQAISRLQRAVIESCKQCGRNHLLSVMPAIAFEELCDLADKRYSEQCDRGGIPNDAAQNLIRLYAHPYIRSNVNCRHFLSVLRELPKDGPSVIEVLIGPEGGLTEGECDRLHQQGWQQITLGENILRVETAATMIAATWNAWRSH